jgi:hypothetical protein
MSSVVTCEILGGQGRKLRGRFKGSRFAVCRSPFAIQGLRHGWEDRGAENGWDLWYTWDLWECTARPRTCSELQTVNCEL